MLSRSQRSRSRGARCRRVSSVTQDGEYTYYAKLLQAVQLLGLVGLALAIGRARRRPSPARPKGCRDHGPYRCATAKAQPHGRSANSILFSQAALLPQMPQLIAILGLLMARAIGIRDRKELSA